MLYIKHIVLFFGGNATPTIEAIQTEQVLKLILKAGMKVMIPTLASIAQELPLFRLHIGGTYIYMEECIK